MFRGMPYVIETLKWKQCSFAFHNYISCQQSSNPIDGPNELQLQQYFFSIHGLPNSYKIKVDVPSLKRLW